VIRKTTELMQINEDIFLAEACRSSFLIFFKEFWEVNNHEKLVINFHHEVLCNELQKVAERVFDGKEKLYDLIINVPPSTSKSSICSIAFPAWIWTRMPHAVIICTSCESRLAERLSRKCRDIIKSDKYKKLFSEIEIRRDNDGVQTFGNTLGGERLTFSTGGNPTGSHAHFIIPDDPLKVLDGDSDAEKYKANLFQNEVLPSRKVDSAVSVEALIMQRIAQDDPTGSKLELGGKIKHLCFPAELSDNVKPAKYKRFYKDGLLDPVRLSRSVLDEKKAILGSFGYACQYMQTPIPREGGMFKTARIQIEDERPYNLVRSIRSWDTAGLKDRGCYTAGCEIGIDTRGVIWFLDMVRGQWDFSEREPIIKQTATADGKNIPIIIERQGGSSGLEVAEATARMLMGWEVIIDLPTGNKADRAGPLASQVNNGNVKMVRGAWNRALIDELQYFPASKYKDQVDALSQGFAHLVDDGKFYGVL